MEECITALSGMTIGMDLGDRHSHLCLLDESGEIVEESRLATTETAMHRWFSSHPPSCVAIEVGTHSRWVSRMLLDCGHRVLVANARKLRLIYENDGKCDRVDARYLARVARLDPSLLAPIQHRGDDVHHDLAVIRSRDLLVGVRTRLVNHVRGVAKATGVRLPSSSTPSFPNKVTPHIPQALQPALAPVLEQINVTTQKIRAYDRLIQRIAEAKYPQSAVLQSVPGVGPVTALTYILTLEDPGRFTKSRAVGAYLGLRPRQSSSGQSEPQLRITKAGDVLLRRLLVGAAQYTLGPFGPDSDLRRWGLSLAARGGKNSKKRAVVGVARKLAVLLHRLWMTGEIYEPFRNKSRTA